MNWYRISKYDPRFRNSNGEYVREEWTSYCDIGNIFGNKEFTLEDYQITENSYVEFLMQIVEKQQSPQFLIEDLEIYDDESSSSFQAGTVGLDHVQSIIRACLREKIWCKILQGEELAIHFGYDYYVYLGLKNEIPFIIGDGKLFVERIKISPYA
jgi:hypothetical protein